MKTEKVIAILGGAVVEKNGKIYSMIEYNKDECFVSVDYKDDLGREWNLTYIDTLKRLKACIG